MEFSTRVTAVNCRNGLITALTVLSALLGLCASPALANSKLFALDLASSKIRLVSSFSSNISSLSAGGLPGSLYFIVEKGNVWPTYKMSIDGSARQRLGWLKCDSVTVSADGSRLAYSSDVNIYTMNADGTGQRRVARDSFVDPSMSWSPTNDRLAFTDSPGLLTGNLYTVASAGGSRNLTYRGHSDGGVKKVQWSPRGDRFMVIYEKPDLSNVLYTVQPGKRPRPLTPRDDDISDFSISPDATKVAVAGSYVSDLMIVDAGTGKKTALNSSFFHFIDQVVWSPDGRELLIVDQSPI